MARKKKPPPPDPGHPTCRPLTARDMVAQYQIALASEIHDRGDGTVACRPASGDERYPQMYCYTLYKGHKFDGWISTEKFQEAEADGALAWDANGNPIIPTLVEPIDD